MAVGHSSAAANRDVHIETLSTTTKIRPMTTWASSTRIELCLTDMQAGPPVARRARPILHAFAVAEIQAKSVENAGAPTVFADGHNMQGRRRIPTTPLKSASDYFGRLLR